MIKVTILFAEMYLAAVILNTIQVCRIFKNLAGTFSIGFLIEGFIMYLTNPVMNAQGVWRSFHDWYWLDKQIYLDENGEFQIREMEDA